MDSTTTSPFNTPLPCICGDAEGEVIAFEDRFNLPLQTKLCDCGILRSDPYYSDNELKVYYQGEYRDRYSKSISDAFRKGVEEGRAIRGIMEICELDWETSLDVGCGSGGSTAVLGGKGYDFDERLIEYGKSRGADVQVGEIGGVFDLVVINHTIEHMRDPVGFLRDVKKKVGKYLFIGVPGIATIGNHYPNIQSYLQDSHCFHFTLKTLMYTAALAGFKLVYGSEAAIAIFEKGGEELEKPRLGPKIREYLTHIAEVEAVQKVILNRYDASYFNTDEPWV